jgi:uncharacterized protein
MFYIRFIIYIFVSIGFSSSNADVYEDFLGAVRNDQASAVRALLQRGVDPNTVDDAGQPALTLALRVGSVQVAALLLQHPQIRIDAKNQAGETALMMAALKGHLPVATQLIERGAAVHQAGWSPMHYAATGPETRIVVLLIERGAPVDALSPNASTPLMMAAQYGSEDTVLLLLQRKASPALRNERGLNAADFARLGGREPLAKQLETAPR